MDLFSRKTVAWTLSDSMGVPCIIDTINKAKARRNTEQPLILHSDRGSQHVSNEYRKATAKMQRSYSKKAFPWDDACIESFHSLIKREWLNRFKIGNYKQAYRLVFEYIEAFYNTSESIVIAIIYRPMTLKSFMKRLLQNGIFMLYIV
jgi:Integrase core domain.